jgi:flagellar M-ring protein FliF
MDATATATNPLATMSAGLRPLLMLIGLAAAVAAGVGVTLWSQGPTFSVLYGTLTDEDAAAITRALSGAGIEYRLDPGTGGLSVPAERLNDARFLLAEQGVTQSGGFAGLAKEGGFGLSSFMEGARYQHALETELAKTISSLQQVAAARVHIASGRNSGFIRDRAPARASVFLQLKAGRSLTNEQVTSIVNLVGTSVPDIDPAQVTVVDQQGRLLSSPQGRGDVALRDQQIETARQLEETYARRIEALIEPLVGAGRVRAEVSAQFDMTTSEEARESFNPAGAVVRSEQVSEDRNASPTASGVPGAAANQPVAVTPTVAAADATPAAAGAAAATVANTPGASATTVVSPTSVQSTRNYEIDRTVAYVRQPGGQLKRLSVAVLVDNVQVQGRDGKFTDAPLTREQIDRITALVKDAVGFDVNRGDSVNVVNSAWRGNPRLPAGEMTSIPVWEQAWFMDAIKALVGLAALMALIFTVIRPLTQRFTAFLPPPPPPVPADDRFILSGSNLPVPMGISEGGDSPLATTNGNGDAKRRATPTKYEEQVNLARSIVNEDPARVAQVVRKWAMNNG